MNELCLLAALLIFMLFALFLNLVNLRIYGKQGKSQIKKKNTHYLLLFAWSQFISTLTSF